MFSILDLFPYELIFKQSLSYYFRYIFALLDASAEGDQALDRFEFESMQPSINKFMGKDDHKNLGVNVSNNGSSDKQWKSSKKAEKDAAKEASKSKKASGGGFGNK
jgi:hypothetical protein